MTTRTVPTRTLNWEATKGAIIRPFAIQNPAIARLSQTLITLLVAVDLLLILLHLVYWYTDATSSDYFSISRERGYGEFFQYIKLFWLVLLFAWYALRSREKRYLFWSAVFGYILLDDSLTIHEHAGEIIRNTFHFSALWGLRGADYGELSFYVLLLGILLLTLGVFYYSGSRAFRQDSHYLLGLLVAFGLFAGVGDVLHMLVRETPIYRMVDVIEDGGEMIVMSFIVWFALLLQLRSSPGRRA
jgi:hypothetical protein